MTKKDYNERDENKIEEEQKITEEIKPKKNTVKCKYTAGPSKFIIKYNGKEIEIKKNELVEVDGDLYHKHLCKYNEHKFIKVK